jgi:CheY-like chemotaxis protein
MGELLMHERLDDRQSGYVHDIVISAKSLLGIINDILDFSKIESGKLELNPIDYDFDSMIDNVESMFVYVTQKKGLTFKLKRGENLPDCLFGDDIRLRQVLTNIIGNAVKFTEEGGVELTVNVTDDEMRFIIEDTGMGIREEDLPGLFNAFEQVDKSKNRSVVGTGLGLSISKSFVVAMGGDITVTSEYGRGTIFTVTVPLVQGNAENIAHSDSDIGADFSAPDAKILITDDNEFNLRVASGLLSLMGIKAETAISGFEAIELVNKNDYDIVFMDHMMPEMDGVETVRRIRALGGKYSKLTIVALTANAVKGAIEMFFSNGFNDFISKPIDASELRKVVKRNLPIEKILEADTDALQTRSKMEDELFKKALMTFVKDNRDTYKSLADALDSNDIKTAHRIAHTLKSSAGYIMKKKLADAAASLEESLAEEPFDYSNGQILAIETELAKVINELEPLLLEAEAMQTETVQISADERAGLLAELRPLLEKSDFGAGDYVDRLSSIEGMEKLAERIDEYDFTGALEVLVSMS